MSEILKEKTSLAAQLKKTIESTNTALKALNEEYDKVCGEILAVFEALEIDSIKMNGFNFYTQDECSVKTPKTDEEKQLFYNYLKSLGIFEETISVHSKSLNALYKTMAEKALKDGITEFIMPGIQPPTSYKMLRLRKI